MEMLDIYLQSQTHKVVSQDIKSNMLSHCYMINSKDEFLLNHLALFVAKEIFCLSVNSPCDTCNNCNKVNHSNMVDLCIYPKSDKGLMVEDVNEIVNDCYIRAMESRYKVYILNRFDECTTQAQNKILKTLEEPPMNVVFVLTCSNEANVLATISSRSKKISEPVLPIDMIEKYLEDKKTNNSSMIACMSDGSLAIANKLAENPMATEIVDICFELLKNLKSSADILKYSSKIVSLKKDFNFFLDTLIIVLRDICVSAVSDNVIFREKLADYKLLAQTYNVDMVYKLLDKICIIPSKLEFNCNLVGVVDQLLLDILEVRFLCQKSV